MSSNGRKNQDQPSTIYIFWIKISFMLPVLIFGYGLQKHLKTITG